jgi:hypothetical protein
MSSASRTSPLVKVLLAVGFLVAAGLIGFGVMSYLHTGENVRIHQEAARRKPGEPVLQEQLRRYEDEHDTAKVILGVGGVCLLLWLGAVAVVVRRCCMAAVLLLALPCAAPGREPAKDLSGDPPGCERRRPGVQRSANVSEGAVGEGRWCPGGSGERQWVGRRCLPG